MINILYELKEIDLSKISEIGGKAANLGELMKLNLNVPTGFVCTDFECDKNEIIKKYEQLNLTNVAVRSSAICEDGKETSFAGQFDTILNVNKYKLMKSIYKCFTSCNNENVAQYAQEKHVEKNNTKVAVIVQQMILGDISGVAFSNNPITGENDILIEFINGIGEKLVQGEITPSQVSIERNGRIKKYLGERILSEDIINNIKNIAIEIEKHYGFPQDIEWTIKNEKLFILQARPITVIGMC